MRVGYSKGWSLSFLALGAVTFGLNLITANAIGLGTGVICLIVGLAYLTRPYFFIETDVLVVPAPLGPLKKRYPFQPGQLVPREGALFLGEKKLGLRRWLADKRAWDQAARQLESSKAFD